MQTLRHLVPSAGNLIIFEAAGRLGSFTAAANELGMSQAAVSYAIRNLEAQLGLSLFNRNHRRISLTQAGQKLHSDVVLGLGYIRKSIESITAMNANGHVTLSISNALASMWMVPRLQEARDALPGIELRLHTSDRDLDIVAENIPLGIRGGNPESWPTYDSRLFAAEEIVAVASPAYVKKFGRPETATAFADHNLIHLEEPWRVAATWEDWLASAGVTKPAKNRGLLINDYVSVIQAALNGQGIALGWRHLVDGMIADGRLVTVSNHALITGSAFYVVWHKDGVLSSNAIKVRDWLVS